jgi:hypothetical protein
MALNGLAAQADEYGLSVYRVPADSLTRDFNRGVVETDDTPKPGKDGKVPHGIALEYKSARSPSS